MLFVFEESQENTRKLESVSFEIRMDKANMVRYPAKNVVGSDEFELPDMKMSDIRMNTAKFPQTV